MSGASSNAGTTLRQIRAASGPAQQDKESMKKDTNVLTATTKTTPSLNATYIISVVTAVIGLAVSQGLITNHIAQIVTGIASVLVPAAFSLAQTFFHTKVAVAKIEAGAKN